MDRLPFRINGLPDLLDRCLYLLYPESSGCIFCHERSCGCQEEILALYRKRVTCKRCGKFLVTGNLCSDCLNRRNGFPEVVRALAPYEGNMRTVIHRFKYFGDKRAGQILSDLLLAGPGREIEKIDIIMPVPLHAKKLRSRGYNQAEILARRLAQGLGIELNTQVLQRTHETKPQFELGRKDRQLNLDTAFTMSSAKAVEGKSILLVDDIITTGFTLQACGLVLQKSGAENVQAVCLAAGRIYV